MQHNLSEVLMRISCGASPFDRLLTWAEHELMLNPDPHPTVYELFSLEPEAAVAAALEMAKDLNGFILISEEGEKIAINIVNEYCQTLMNGDLSNIRFCKVIRYFDDHFMGFRQIGDNLFKYPPWLGDLWNSCDWIEAGTSRATEQLVAEAQKVWAYNQATYGKSP